jgi:uncharacterized cupredoxin-like copper-binding protein
MLRSRTILLVLALTGVALVAAMSAAAALRLSNRTDQATVTRVTVLAGKPSEFKYKLSRATIPKGTVFFKVVNRGAIVHDFKIAGKKTRMLAPGKSQTLRVVFRKAKRYPFLCTVPGHVAAGMKGVLRVK